MQEHFFVYLDNIRQWSDPFLGVSPSQNAVFTYRPTTSHGYRKSQPFRITTFRKKYVQLQFCLKCLMFRGRFWHTMIVLLCFVCVRVSFSMQFVQSLVNYASTHTLIHTGRRRRMRLNYDKSLLILLQSFPQQHVNEKMHSVLN